MASSKDYKAGVKEYRDMYWAPDYVPLDTDLLACFKVTGQPGVPNEEVAAAVAFLLSQPEAVDGGAGQLGHLDRKQLVALEAAVFERIGFQIGAL